MESPQLRRRNSIATSVVVPSKLTLPIKPHHAASFPPTAAAAATAAASSSSSSSSTSSQSFPLVDFELISIKPLSYTSLKDLIPYSSSAVQSPTSATPGGGGGGGEISIRNRLVKQAAWAYLQPMSTSPESSGGHFLRRFWARISGDFFNFLRFVNRTLTRAFSWVIPAVWVHSSR